jgi:hypothetical protein
MRLFHGTNQQFEVIDLGKSRTRRDFGRGFYLTTLESQAKDWAKTMRDRFGGEPTVYTYEFEFIDDLNVKQFDGLSIEWLEMVKHNRLEECPIHDFDVVIGPVANANTMRVVALYVEGTYDAEYAIEKLKHNKVNDQVSIHSEKAVAKLKRIGSYTVKNDE